MRVTILALLAAGLVRGAAPDAAVTPEQVRPGRHRDALWDRGKEAWQAGKQDEAIAALEKALAIELQILGPWHRSVEVTAHRLATWHQARGEWRRSADLRRLIFESRRRLDGERHWMTVDARIAWQDVVRHSSRSAAQREALARSGKLLTQSIALHNQRQPEKAIPLARKALELQLPILGGHDHDVAETLSTLAHLLQAAGDYKAALRAAEQAAAARKAALGENHPDYADSLNTLAVLHGALGDHTRALALQRESLGLTRELHGASSPHYGTGLGNLARLYQSRGDHQAALSLHNKAVAIFKLSPGEQSPEYARSLNMLATCHQARGEHHSALRLYQQALAIRKQAVGERHPDYANSLHNLATLHHAMGDHSQALFLYEKALSLRGQLLGERHPSYQTTLTGLALLHKAIGSYQQALTLYEKSLKLRKASSGERHIEFAIALDNLAMLYLAAGKARAALPLSQKALPLFRDLVGERHPSYATSLNNLALIHHELKDHPNAISLFHQALAIVSANRGVRHPSYAEALSNLSVMYNEMGRPSAALPLQEQAIHLTSRHLASIASVQSERQQLAAVDALRHRLSIRLSIPDEAAHFSHNHVLSWKGAAFAAQQARRLFLQAQADPATRQLSQDLLDANRSLALLSSRPGPAAQERLRELTLLKEEKEARLAELSAPFRDAVRPPPSERFRAALPPGVVLVDFLVYAGTDPAKPMKGQTVQRRLAAWVVRADAATVRVDLGLMGPVEEALSSWRRALEDGRDPGASPARLREAVWRPLERRLAGATAILISPDRALGRLPFAALPGSKPGTHLLEEHALAVLPIPQALPRLLHPVAGKPSLLAAGGVDFGEGAGPWDALHATGPEADAVAARFRALLRAGVVTLSGAKATRAALRDALPKHRFAHLATHGFFAPASMKSALGRDDKGEPGLFGAEGVTGWHPGLLSGLVCAGANRPTAEDDGVLTALEIAETDLSGVELAVLSACQTGLGQEAGGEGMLGLQRAFAVAGCRSVVSSLWSVHDVATLVLMERLYHHLWAKKLPKIEALRRAQLDVMRHPEWVEERAKKMAGLRGLRGMTPKAAELPKGAVRRSPPAWWAAWQLSGDWR